MTRIELRVGAKNPQVAHVWINLARCDFVRAVAEQVGPTETSPRLIHCYLGELTGNSADVSRPFHCS
jgi:hypothetical protein